MFEDVRDGVSGDGAPPAGAAPEPALPEPADSGGAAPAGAAPQAEPAAVDYKDRWLRAEAELQNVRRRAAREREEAVQRAEERVLLEVIELLDDLERALATLGPQHADEPWVQGVLLTAQRMRDALARHGIAPIPTLGQPFDPNVHEALLEIDAPDDVTPGHVAQEVLRGYRRGDRALRAARVVVARTPAGS